MSLRYRKISALLLAAMLTTIGSSSLMAQNQGPKVRGNVYGGGNAANVGATSTVNISAGQIGNDGQTSYQEDHGNVFGGGKGETTVVTGNVTVNIGKEGQSSSGATIKGDVYGGSAKGKVNGDVVDATKATNVTLNKGTVNGSVYGGGLGDNTNAADVYGKVTVTVNNGTAGNVFGCNNVNGAPKSTVEVTIQGGQVTNSVYGGGNAAPYEGNPTVTMNGGSAANIYGGGLGSTAVVTGDVAVTINGGTVSTNVYGGGSEANLTGSVDVNIKGGTVTGDVYGGGAKAHTNTANWNDTNDTWAEGALDDGKTIKKTTVNLLGGTVGNAYGGGLGDLGSTNNEDDDIPAYVYGDVAVTINGTAFTKGTGKGQVFGCNNLKGTPKGSVGVVVERTVRTDGGEHQQTTSTANNYEIKAIYGGGNQAPYLPVNSTNQKTKVEVKSCQTSIEYVYGGGNSASVPETNVAIEGAFEIGSVFGGGNGSDEGSPGANVTGNTNTVLYGGTIHSVFGGSNKLGTIGGDTNLNIPTPLDESGCPLQIKEVYGAGREADVNNDVIIEIGCLADGVRDVYGGAYNANINGKIQLTITSGILQNVFGGNNSGGKIKGPVTVNIEETDNCKPIKITNLYGAGNEADYPSKENKNSSGVTNPSVTVNVKACTSIDNIYGGGRNADVYGDTEVNINMVKGWWAGKTYGSGTTALNIPNAIGTIGNVYGGGQNGKVYYSNSTNKTHGNATVNIGTATTVGFVTEPVHLRLSTAPDTELTKTDGLYVVNVEGAKIVGDVYGGGEGNTTTIDGTAQVNLGATGISYTPEVTGNIYGGSAFGTVNVAQVNLVKGTVAMNGTDATTGNVFGGGKGQNGNSNTNPATPEYTAHVTGSTTVTLNGATVTNAIYGGCNTNGVVGTSGTTATTVTATVALKGGTVGSSSATDMSALQTVFGGGLGSNTHTYGKTVVNVGVETTDNSNIYGNVYGGSRNGSIGAVAVDLKAGTIHGNVYGGGYETTANTIYVTRATDAATTVDVTVEGATFEIVNDATDATVVKTGQVFGCNNVTGSPTGHVKVEVKSTAQNGTQAVDVAAVYGGGNQADYLPTTADDYAEVLINRTENGRLIVGKVFGGGNAADIGDTGNNGVTAGTQVTLTDGEVKNGIYGGCNTEGTVTANTSVTLSGGTVGAENSAGEVCGGGLGKDTKVINGTSFVYVGTGTVGDETTFAGTTTLYGDIYGGSAYGEVNNTEVNLFKLAGTSFGYNVFGGGKGNYVSENNTANIEAKVNGTATVNMYALTISGDDDAAAVYGGCNVNGTTATAIVNLIGGTIGTSGTEADKVFGGGKGNATTTTTATVNVGSSTTVGSTTIYSNVYGGSALGAVGTATVNLNKATTLAGDVYGGGMGRLANTTVNPPVTAQAATVTTPTVLLPIEAGVNLTITGSGATAFGGNIYGGCNKNGTVSGKATVNLYGGTVPGDVYGGGKGDLTTFATTGSVEVNVGKYESSTLSGNTNITGDVYGGSALGNVNNPVVNVLSGGTINNIYGGGLGNTSTVSGNVTVNIGKNEGNAVVGNPTVTGDVYGGSAKGSVNTNTTNTTTVNLLAGNVNGSVFGGGMGDHESLGTGHSNITATTEGAVRVNVNSYMSGLTGIYGGANINGLVKGAIDVNINANVGATGNGNSRNIFGGGYGENTNTEGNVTVTIGDEAGNKTPVIYGDIYGGSAMGNVNNEATDITKVDFLNGTLHGSIYGGGLGRKAADAVPAVIDPNTNQETTPAVPAVTAALAKVNGVVQINISSSTQTAAQCKIDLRDANIYGCNNTNGSPQDNVTVNIYQTAHNYSDYTTGDKYKATYTETVNNIAPDYAINQVFGGGNQADYAPENGLATSEKKATVNIVNCDNTIRRVFGGGNAAAAVGVVTEINGGRFNYVYGGGNGEVSAANIGAGGTNLQIHGGYINNLFGGSNNSGTISGPMGVTVDNNGGCGEGNTSVDEFFCGNNMASIGTAQNPVTITATISCGTRFGAVYGGCNLAPIYGHVNLNVEGGIMDYVYGGSKGSNDQAADISGNVTLTIKGGQIKNVFGGSNINGNIAGSIEVNIEKNDASTCADGWYIGNVYGASNLAAYTPTTAGNYPAVNIKNGTVNGNVYGGGKGSTAIVTSSPVVTIGDTGHENYNAVITDASGDKDVDNNNLIGGNVYGGGDLAQVIGSPSVSMIKGTIGNDLYGGGNQADVKGSVTVSIQGGTVTHDVYGGGALASTNTNNPTNTNGKITDTSLNNTKIYLLGGTINNNVYGGGLGEKNGVDGKTDDRPAYVNGDVKVYLNGMEIGDYDATKHSALVTPVDIEQDNTIDYYHTNDNTGCVVKGSIFGCNNLCGTPKGKVKVHVFKTQGDSERQKTLPAKKTSKTASDHSYELTAVYGGGNLAAYEPDIIGTESETTHMRTEVVIEGCDLTSIQYVYGGGNAASTPATNVIVNGSYEIGEVFGGGNGAGTVRINNADQVNPGANVGFREYGAAWGTYTNPYNTKENRAQYYGYGFGKANVNINGGLVHAVYGGSNSKGNVREVAIAMLDHVEKTCDFKVDEAYGGGKSADMDGKAILQLGCIPSIAEVYGGAQNADVNGDVELTITNGTYDRIFGGNNEGGTINGTITVNIEETGCEPIIIGQLFGGGNQAAYEAPAGKDGPTINVKSFTSIGEIYGGGFSADVTGDVYVNINEVVGGKANETNVFAGDIITLAGHEVERPAFTKGQIGAIGYVYGGGYGADVIGDVEVNIGTKEKIEFITNPTNLTADSDGKYTVEGAKITGSVYGGGYGAATTVTGNVAVNIGGEENGSFVGGNIAIGGSVYGGSALGAVNATRDANDNTKLSLTSETTTTNVTLKKGTVSTAVFGGGMGNANNQAKVYGKAVVNFYGDVISEGLYGGCDFNGKMFNGTELNLMGGRIGNTFTAVPEGGIPEIVFGGGLGALTIVDGTVDVNMGTETTPGSCTIYSNVYGGSKNGSVAVANVNLYGGTIWGNVFGGGYQTAEGKTAATDVNVTLDGTKFECLYSGTGDDAVPQTGQIFGCNNLKGTPTGHVKVHVKKTMGSDKPTVDTQDNPIGRESRTTYDVAAIYGGGNKANYEPAANEAKPYTEVIVEGCELTSIKDVYGGGNAAAVPATNVKVKGSYIINRVFGGGNGYGTNNPGADVGISDHAAYVANHANGTYGTGKAETKLLGGYINAVFGGSNSKGDIAGGTDVKTKVSTDDISDCCPELVIGGIYGAGSNADMAGDVNIVLDCMPDDYVGEVYGGAMNANIDGNVSLTVTSGKFGRVFGGNNSGGSINGSITVNVNEGGCKPLEIGELFGGGNAAPYSVYGTEKNSNGQWVAKTSGKRYVAEGEDAIKVNVVACTSIGKVFGGGFGSTAEVIGDTHIDINMMKGYVNDQEQKTIGRIGQVFGGGSAANVTGNTTIDVGTATVYGTQENGVNITNGTYLNPLHNEYLTITAAESGIYGGGEAADVFGNTTLNIGTVYQKLNTNITGNIFGGGYGHTTKVTGDVEVNIGKKTVTEEVATYVGFANITGDVYGGSAMGSVNAYDKDGVLTASEGKSTKVNLYGGSITGNLYGGGLGQLATDAVGDPGDDNYQPAKVAYAANVYGPVTVTVEGGKATNVYGCNNLNGEPQSTVNVTINNTAEENDANNKFVDAIGSVFGGGNQANYTNGTPVVLMAGGHVNTIFGGGDHADVAKNTSVTMTGGYVKDRIYGGGNLGSVGIFTLDSNDNYVCPEGTGVSNVTINGGLVGPEGTENTSDMGLVFGGGKGAATSFKCDNGMVDKTNVIINNGTVTGTVYGGGEVGRVEHHTEVTIGLESEGSAPVIMGSVFAAGKGVNTHGYAALVRGNATLVVQGDAKVMHSVYGGGEIASVGRYKVAQTDAEANEHGVEIGMPYSLANNGSGVCAVTVKGNAEIGLDDMKMTADGGPDDTGYVFGAGKGVLPYEGYTANETPWRMTPANTEEHYSQTEYNGEGDYETAYLKYIETLALATQTEVTISGNAFIKGSVYGGSENGHVQHNTHVTIEGGQIGNGAGINQRYTEDDWKKSSLAECSHWDYDATDGSRYDKYATYQKDGKYYYDAAFTQSAEGGAPQAKDGQTFFGNVFGGGSGYYPYAPGKWHSEAGSVGGDTKVEIKGGHILSNVYGGNELTDVTGSTTIIMSGGTIGVPRTKDQVAAHPMSCSIFGGGKGDSRAIFNEFTNVSSTKVEVTGGTIYGSVFGGAEDGHVTGSTDVLVSGGTIGIIGIGGESTGNVYAGGKGNLNNVKAGLIMGNTKLNVTNGTIYHNIYGGGAYGSVGTYTYDANGNITGRTSGGKAEVTITGGTIGTTGQENGMVFGSSRGDVATPDDNGVDPNDRLAWVYDSHVVIGTKGTEGPHVRGSIYGSGENGHVYKDVQVDIHSGTIGIESGVDVISGGVTYSGANYPYRGNVYGGGCGTDTYPYNILNDKNEVVKEVGKYNPLAGIVLGNVTVNVDGGHVARNVYGGGAMGSVGTVTSKEKHADIRTVDGKEAIYGFGLSWPYKLAYKENTGLTTVNITGGTIGIAGTTGGDVYGASRGEAGDRYEMAELGNVRETKVTIKDATIYGSVYGGAENGHVNEDTDVKIESGTVKHSVFGGGKGMGKYTVTLYTVQGNTPYTSDIYSMTAGKVYGNTNVTMSGGEVGYNVYGGGDMGSVGKGNYAGGADDYSTGGYGETLEGNLWSNTDFMNSGKTKVKITGGTIGTESDPNNTIMPTGNVFGGCRGEASPNVDPALSPRYHYFPVFYVGYVNETDVEIDGDNVQVLGSVYGGGQDGHVRRNTNVTIKEGAIGKTYDANDTQIKNRGNVYGSGSGLGTYKEETEQVKTDAHSTSSGSVTGNTTVTIKGGTIYQNVYGGGALSSVGAPKIGQPADATKAQTLCQVNIEGGNIGTADGFNNHQYGGLVFGAGRGGGLFDDEVAANYATSIWTEVNVKDGTVHGSVFGGGEQGLVKQSVVVNVEGGTVEHDVYGGGALANTNTSNPEGKTDECTTTVNLIGGTIGNAYGGALGQKSGINGANSDVAAYVNGDVTVTLDGSIVTGNVFGCNNINGTPKGHTLVHVKQTKERTGQTTDDYDVAAVYGGGSRADYDPIEAKMYSEVIIEGCDKTSIKEVYGGGYGAATPGTLVLIKGTKKIESVFGGGYGASTASFNNPGANVGYYSNGTPYDNSNKAIVQLMAGTVKYVYGGSNTKGDIRRGSSVTNVVNTNEPGCCDKLTVEQIYGGGKNAEMQGGAEIVLGCMPNDWIEEIYAGAENADVGNDVSLTITSGKFGRVFGGNKSGGRLNGGIEVNIEESGKCGTPIVIGELYGGGNEAPYSVYGYKDEKDSKGKWIPRTEADYNAMTEAEKDAEGILNNHYHMPWVNVSAFTCIGNIFGGGYGEDAVMVGSPEVNINEIMVVDEDGNPSSVAYDVANDSNVPAFIDGVNVKLYRHDAGKMGVIGNVFGGGNAAKVIGNTNVHIAIDPDVDVHVMDANGEPVLVEGVPKKETRTVLGADIRGNVYGGGNNAEVTGKTNVVIGK